MINFNSNNQPILPKGFVRPSDCPDCPCCECEIIDCFKSQVHLMGGIAIDTIYPASADVNYIPVTYKGITKNLYLEATTNGISSANSACWFLPDTPENKYTLSEVRNSTDTSDFRCSENFAAASTFSNIHEVLNYDEVANWSPPEYFLKLSVEVISENNPWRDPYAPSGVEGVSLYETDYNCSAPEGMRKTRHIVYRTINRFFIFAAKFSGEYISGVPVYNREASAFIERSSLRSKPAVLDVSAHVRGVDAPINLSAQTLTGSLDKSTYNALVNSWSELSNGNIHDGYLTGVNGWPHPDTQISDPEYVNIFSFFSRDTNHFQCGDVAGLQHFRGLNFETTDGASFALGTPSWASQNCYYGLWTNCCKGKTIFILSDEISTETREEDTFFADPEDGDITPDDTDGGFDENDPDPDYPPIVKPPPVYPPINPPDDPDDPAFPDDPNDPDYPPDYPNIYPPEPPPVKPKKPKYCWFKFVSECLNNEWTEPEPDYDMNGVTAAGKGACKTDADAPGQSGVWVDNGDGTAYCWIKYSSNETCKSTAPCSSLLETLNVPACTLPSCDPRTYCWCGWFSTWNGTSWGTPLKIRPSQCGLISMHEDDVWYTTGGAGTSANIWVKSDIECNDAFDCSPCPVESVRPCDLPPPVNLLFQLPEELQ